MNTPRTRFGTIIAPSRDSLFEDGDAPAEKPTPTVWKGFIQGEVAPGMTIQRIGPSSAGNLT